ncbi:MAG: dihydroneopterin triphosphate 2'-epimerase [Reinekea sp.]|jgi:D-erythro-7,8-dihydroneopterin triphosphate epimerase
MHIAMINIKNLRLRTYIGFNPEELEKQQDIIINAEVHYPADTASTTDNEADAVNYKVITKRMIQFVEHGRFKLLEKLVADLLEIAMEHPDVRYARVTVDKPHALRFADSVSITMEDRRS